ncbi:hypothetical protein ACRALDRAFT_1063445, partial [Sodiomyces alcalophilus JCM 7366]|uniref:uncharacterized protein n=1 Tax=Sodiomyces alcalophilus JCM 7366 TaxID=591952 RepID=UPI0039B39853
MPSRERPESVQLFGKTIFNRGTRLRRESSANSSSGSSLYSTDRSVDGIAPPAKEYIPGLFGRKKGQLKSDATTLDRQSSDTGNRKLQISGPFNLHHVTQTQTRHDRAPASQRAVHSPTGPSMEGIEAGDAFYHSYFSSGSPATQYDAAFVDSSTSAAGRTLPSHPQRPLPPPQRQRGFSAPRRLVKRTRSQEQLYISVSKSPPPPRPPRSPVEPTPPPPRPPVAPPRLSSRASLRYDGFEPSDRMSPGRSHTSGDGFYQPESFGPPSSGMDPHAALEVVDTNQFEGYDMSARPRPSHALTTPDDAAWPLKTSAAFQYETPLPNVPEEDENHGAARRSELSLASNKSSLRGSHSVPMLRQVAQLQSNGTQPPPSGTPDTLGHLERTAPPSGALNMGERNMGAEISVSRESWEDDIDYVYEHEAEADFDYAWDRPSLEVSREAEFLPSMDNEDEEENEERGAREDDWAADTGIRPRDRRDSELESFGLKPVPARHLNIPTLSPADAGTNPGGPITAQVSTATSESSHLRAEPRYRSSNRLHVRTDSQASSFKESHGFTLSPSLLIPRDFQQQVVMAGSEVDKLRDDSTTRAEGDFPYGDEPPMTLSTSGLYINERHSTSTTGSNSTGRSSASAERHVSTHSDSTALTRYTASTIFEGWNPKAAEASEPVPSVQLDTFSEVSSPKRAKAPTSPTSETEYAAPHSPGDERGREYYGGVAHHDDQMPKTMEPAKQPARPRGHTNNLSVSGRGYALFPPAYAGN